MRNSIDNPRTFRVEHPNRFRVKKYDERLTDNDMEKVTRALSIGIALK